MAILLDEKTRVLVQGITGRTGAAATRYMLEYGTKVVAGVTPGKGGQSVWGVPVYDSVREAVEERGPIDASVLFVPARALKDAALEAMEIGIPFLIMPVERVPLHDILEMVAHARRKGVKILGPGSFGIISPGKAVAGWIGGSVELAEESFRPGPVGVMSRSGGMTTTVCWFLARRGIGVSTALHMGAEPIVGLSFPELLPLFEEDEQTKVVVLYGEIGTVAEEEAAEVIAEGRFTKPLVAYVAGAGLQPGVRYSHASAIVARGRGSAESKIRALKEAGAIVVERLQDIAPTVELLLKEVEKA
ncbi:succinate--CoA ligase subunit alpha [Candidatus Bathyarchaeota archaeon]|nr:MAG: succinate--CoA ligase subunit alpha [Candidatus Bathyarchaeota archaeon]